MNESEKCAKKDLAHIWHPASQMKDYEDFPPIIIGGAICLVTAMMRLVMLSKVKLTNWIMFFLLTFHTKQL